MHVEVLGALPARAALQQAPAGVRRRALLPPRLPRARLPAREDAEQVIKWDV